MLTEFKMKLFINTGLITLTLVMGILLHKTGKPYNSGIFTVHKLATVAFVILMSKLFLNQVRFGDFIFLYQFMVIVSVFSVLGLLLSGAFMSLDKMPIFMLGFHRIATVIFLLSITAVLSMFNS